GDRAAGEEALLVGVLGGGRAHLAAEVLDLLDRPRVVDPDVLDRSGAGGGGVLAIRALVLGRRLLRRGLLLGAAILLRGGLLLVGGVRLGGLDGRGLLGSGGLLGAAAGGETGEQQRCRG